MANYGWDVVQKRAKILAGATASDAFAIPNHAGSMTIVVGALDGGASWKLQNLVPPGQDSETWYDSYIIDPATGSAIALAGYGTSIAVTFSTSTMPAGVVRIVASASQTADKDFSIMFAQFQA